MVNTLNLCISPYRLNKSALKNLSTCPLQVSFNLKTSKHHSSAPYQQQKTRLLVFFENSDNSTSNEIQF